MSRLPPYIPRHNQSNLIPPFQRQTQQTQLQSNPQLQPNPQPLKRLIRCIHLEDRIEHRTGCNGMMCAHNCELALPAVPGGFCQQCNKYEPELYNNSNSGLGWVEGMGIVENK